MDAPIVMPIKRAHNLRTSLILFAWRLPNGIMNASDGELESSGDVCETWSWVCGGAVVFGVLAEVAIAFCHPPYDSFLERWGSVIANAVVMLGVAGEVQFSMMAFRRDKELKLRSEKKVVEANARAAEALLKAEEERHARVKLEANLQPRSLNQEQWNLVQGFKDRLPFINIAYETDAETWRYAGQFRDTFLSAGISVGMYPRAADVHNWGMLIYEPNGFDGSRARSVEPLIELIRKSDIPPPLAIITVFP